MMNVVPVRSDVVMNRFHLEHTLLITKSRKKQANKKEQKKSRLEECYADTYEGRGISNSHPLGIVASSNQPTIPKKNEEAVQILLKEAKLINKREWREMITSEIYPTLTRHSILCSRGEGVNISFRRPRLFMNELAKKVSVPSKTMRTLSTVELVNGFRQNAMLLPHALLIIDNGKKLQ